MNWEHNIKRAILFLALVTILAGSKGQAHDEGKSCFIARLTPDGRAYLEPKPCKPEPPTPPAKREKELTKPQEPKANRT